jgi:hypothetical protein
MSGDSHLRDMYRDAMDRIKELETEVEALKHDLKRSMANHLADLNPCDCVGCICVQQTTPHMMRSNTFCKMPRATASGGAVE